MKDQRLLLFLYADDIVFLSYSRTTAQETLNLLEEYCSTIILTVNVTKTKAVIFSRLNHRKKLRLKYVKHFTYLGVSFTLSSKFIEADHVKRSVSSCPCKKHFIFFKIRFLADQIHFNSLDASTNLYTSKVWTPHYISPSSRSS